MNTESKEKARQRTQMLVGLRKQHGESVKQAQELLKVQQAARKTLSRAMQAGPRSAPQLAAASGLAAREVLWHLAAMKKYGLIEEAGMDDAEEYYLYRLSKEGMA
jgi:predicted transcriptional regulator